MNRITDEKREIFLAEAEKKLRSAAYLHGIPIDEQVFPEAIHASAQRRWRELGYDDPEPTKYVSAKQREKTLQEKLFGGM